MTHKSLFVVAEKLWWALDPAGAGHQQWGAATFLWPWHWYSLPMWQGKELRKTFRFWTKFRFYGHEELFVHEAGCFNQWTCFDRVTAASDTLRWQTRPHTFTISPCTAVKRVRRAWATCPREDWKSTSVRLQGKHIQPFSQAYSVLAFSHKHTKRSVF